MWESIANISGLRPGAQVFRENMRREKEMPGGYVLPDGDALWMMSVWARWCISICSIRPGSTFTS